MQINYTTMHGLRGVYSDSLSSSGKNQMKQTKK